MNIRIVSCAWACLFVAFGVTGANAAVWQWGCRGKLGDEQMIFTRYSLVLLDADAKRKREKLEELIRYEDLAAHTGAFTRFESDNGNDGFVKKIEFKSSDDIRKQLTLVEKASRKLKATHGRAGPRDEDKTFFSKTYRVTVAGEKPRDVMMNCLEYTLSTKGGRG
jgi:hypothetical protein